MARPDAAAFIWRPVAAGVAGLIGTAICWFVLAWAIWFPYWKELRAVRMYTDDIGMTYLLPFGPPMVGIFFGIAAHLALLILRLFPGGRFSFPAATSMMALPAVAVFLLLNPKSDGVWHYPLAEVAVLLIGLLIGYFLLRRYRQPVASVPV